MSHQRKKNFRLLFIVACLAGAPGLQAAPLPHSADIRYEVRWGPATVEATQQWRVTGKHYQLSTELKLPFPFTSRRYLSQGELSPQGLLPLRYDEFQIGDPVPRHQALFDAVAHQLRVGEPPSLKKSYPLDSRFPAQAQDLNALPFQLSWLEQAAIGLPLLVTNGKGAVQHRFEQRPSLPFVWQGQVLNTLRLVSHASDGDLEVWLAPSLGNLPVRVVRSQDGKSLRFDAREIQFAP
jgi:hypothetical protein